MPVAVPVEDRFAKAGASRYDGDIVFGVIHAAIEVKNILRAETLKTFCCSNEIVHEDDAFARQLQTCSESGGIESPGNMCRMKNAIHHSAGNTKSGGHNGAARNRRQGMLRKSFD